LIKTTKKTKNISCKLLFGGRFCLKCVGIPRMFEGKKLVDSDGTVGVAVVKHLKGVAQLG